MSTLSKLECNVEWQEECRQFVGREVYYCVSSLVHELAQNEKYQEDLWPVCISDDYVSAAYDHINNRTDYSKTEKSNYSRVCEDVDAARDYCEENNVEPYTSEAFEHWIISDWLADKLEKKGEMVLRDFLGLTIWGRTTTGQAIYIDRVITEIVLEALSETTRIKRLIEDLSKS